MFDKKQLQAPDALPELIQATLDSLPAHIAILGDNGEILAVNAAWRRFADANGYVGANYGLGTNYLQLCASSVGVDADEARAAARGLREVMLAQREEFALEYPCHSPTKRRWFTMRASRFVGSGPLHVLIAHEEVTERKLAQEGFSESYRRWQALFENAPAAILIANDQSRYIDANPAACALTGYSRQELLSRSVVDVALPQLRADTTEAWHRFVADGEQDGNLLLLCKDGTSVQVEYRAVANIVPGLHLSILRDITERTHAEAVLRQQAERLHILHAIEQAILSAESSEQIALVALHAIHDLIAYRRGSVIMLDIDAQEALVSAVRNDLEPIIHAGPRYSFAELSVTDEMLATLREGATYRLDLPALAPRTALVERMLAEGLRYCLCLPLIAQGTLIGALQIAIDTISMPTDEQAAYMRDMVVPIAVAIQQARLFEQVRVGHERLQELSRRLVEIQETERRQIAQELHDQIGQNLTALGLNLNLLRNLLPADALPILTNRLDESLQLVDDMVQRIRDVMSNLRPSVLDDYGLAAALRWYVKQFAERTQLDVTSRIARVEPLPRLPPMVETALFRVAQEALNNIARHANARQVTLILKTYDRFTRLSITDNGVGFNPDEAYPPGQRHNLGLIGMRERVATVGGSLRIESTPGQGTRVVAEVPHSPDAN